MSSYTWMVARSFSRRMISPTSSLCPTRTNSYMALPAMLSAITTACRQGGGDPGEGDGDGRRTGAGDAEDEAVFGLADDIATIVRGRHFCDVAPAKCARLFAVGIRVRALLLIGRHGPEKSRRRGEI